MSDDLGDDATYEEPRPRDEVDLGRRYARDDDVGPDRPPPRRLAQIGEPPGAQRRPSPRDPEPSTLQGPPRAPGVGVWREPPTSRLDNDPPPGPAWREPRLLREQPRSEPEAVPEREAEPRVDTVVVPRDELVERRRTGPRRPNERELDIPVPATDDDLVDDDDEDDDEDQRRRPPSWYRRGDDDAPRVRRDPPPRKRVVAPAEARVQPAVAASRRAHPTGRPDRPPSDRRRVSSWPGSNTGALPPDFPGGRGAPDLDDDPPRPRAPVPDLPRSRKDAKRAKARAKAKPKAALPDKATGVDKGAPDRSRLSLRPPQRFNNIVGAVYAALADPLSADSAEAREQRAARVREVGLIAASSALVAVLVYGIFPVRTFLTQRSATSDAQERLEKISEENERMRREADQLRDDEDIELRARSDYGWVFPGEEQYGVLPSPVAEPLPDAPEGEATTTTSTGD